MLHRRTIPGRVVVVCCTSVDKLIFHSVRTSSWSLYTLPDKHNFKIGDRVLVNGPWQPFTGTVVRILDLKPTQLIVERDDGEGTVAVRIIYCKHLPPPESES